MVQLVNAVKAFFAFFTGLVSIYILYPMMTAFINNIDSSEVKLLAWIALYATMIVAVFVIPMAVAFGEEQTG